MRRGAIFALAVFSAMLFSSELALSLPMRGVGPDIAVMVLVIFAATDDPKAAAFYGFGAGLLRDLLLSSPVGLSALAYGFTAYVVSLIGLGRGLWVSLGLIAGATVFSQFLYGLATIVIGSEVTTAALPRVISLTTIYNAILAPFLVPPLRKLATSKALIGATE